MPKLYARVISSGALRDASLLSANPSKHEAYWVELPGEPPVDWRTGKPYGEAATDPEEGAPATGDSKNDLTYEQRESQILEAVVNISTDNYGKPAAGRPALPRKAAVESLTGFKVTLDEIQKATATKEALGLESPLDPEETPADTQGDE